MRVSVVSFVASALLRVISRGLPMLVVLVLADAARGQDDGAADQVETPQAEAGPSPPGNPNTTVIPRTSPAEAKPSSTKQKNLGADEARVKLVALLTADGQPIDRGLVWRVYRENPNAEQKTKLLKTHRVPTPELVLKSGTYVVNAAFGRAHLTRQLKVLAGQTTTESFVINAGGLKMDAFVGGKKAPARDIRYDVFEGERDQTGQRTAVMTDAKPGLIIRLNAGIYHIVSRYGDTNVNVSADVTVEAGKLTVATVTHEMANVTFKLVKEPGGEAIPRTQWTIKGAGGVIIKRSVGALPSHVLAPGTYTVVAKASGKAYEQEFSVSDGMLAIVEVLVE